MILKIIKRPLPTQALCLQRTSSNAWHDVYEPIIYVPFGVGGLAPHQADGALHQKHSQWLVINLITFSN